MKKKQDNVDTIIKFVVSGVLDLLDIALNLSLFRIPILGRFMGIGFDLGLTIIAGFMWGWEALLHLWEVLDVSDTLDMFPTMTAIGIISEYRRRKK